MTSRISHTTIDCRNAYELSEWWKQVLGYADIPDDPNEPGHEECMIHSTTDGHRILFIEVPERKSVKNRMHWDVTMTDPERNNLGPFGFAVGSPHDETAASG